jgi:uncharacterized protein YecT (DUF1311 family)
MKFNLLCLMVASIACSTDAFAVDCNNPPGGTDLASAQTNYQCAEKDRVAADAKLNQVYKKLTGLLKDDPEQETTPKSQVVAAQRAWVAFRDAECDFRTSLNGGARQWLIVNHSQCLTELTTERTKVLQGYLDQAQDQ